MEIAKLVLEYFKVFLSTPVIGGLVAIVALIFLGGEIKALIQRIAKIRLPGGSEVSTSQIEKAIEAPSGRADPPNPIGGSPVLETDNPTAQDFQRLKQHFDAERIRAFLWEYRYLNFFLVRHTQQFLDWLIGLQNPTTVPHERQAVLNALLTHHLIQLNGELIEVTPKGREYVQWRGPLLPLPG